MPDSNQEQSDSSQSKNVNIDELLEQVGELTQRAKKLVSETESSPKAPESPPTTLLQKQPPMTTNRKVRLKP